MRVWPNFTFQGNDIPGTALMTGRRRAWPSLLGVALLAAGCAHRGTMPAGTAHVAPLPMPVVAVLPSAPSMRRAGGGRATALSLSPARVMGSNASTTALAAPATGNTTPPSVTPTAVTGASLPAVPPVSLHTDMTAGIGGFEATLDAQLAAHSYDALSQSVMLALDGDDADLSLRTTKWLMHRVMHGTTDSALIARLYTQALVAQAARTDGTSRERRRRDAATAYVRTLALVATEGGQCRDPAIVKTRLAQITRDLAPADAILHTYPDDQYQAIGSDALTLLQLGFPARYPDDWLCAGSFRPYGDWSPGRPAAMRAFAASLHLSDLPSQDAPKAAEIIPLYVRGEKVAGAGG